MFVIVDFVNKETRSKIMASIRSKNTSIDRKMASMLRKTGIGFRRYPKMPGSPDFIIKGRKVAVFCDGDFWHGYDFKRRKGKLSPFWRSKIENNIKRDRKINLLLSRMSWKVIRLWEHDINKSSEKCIRKIAKAVGP